MPWSKSRSPTLGRSGIEGDRVAPDALTTAVNHVFLGTTVLAALMLAGVLLMPRDRTPARPPVREASEVAAG
jgi:hypothetical protein